MTCDLLPYRLAFASLLGFASLSITLTAGAGGPVEFQTQIAPILQQHCVRCHQPGNEKGGISLATADDLRADGFVVAGDPGSSDLLELITAADGNPPRMPQDADPLTDQQVSLIQQWIAAGAPWPRNFELEPAAVSDRDWWSLRPLRQPAAPSHDAEHPVDAFIDAKLAEQELAPVGQADPRTLIRRITYDLTGLPPKPEAIETFLRQHASDPEAAWTGLVDRLLDSPEFGEKLAQHWLDLARYAETHGYDKDKPREDAWPYRDYVIRSFNQDKPYARFVQEQVAGDVLFPDDPDGVLGLGFLAAGPWDFIGHWEVGEGKLDGRIAKHLDRDEMVSAVFNVFQSTTIQCARCHHHKFDPIRMEDYYRLHAVFAAVDRADRVYQELPPRQQREKRELVTRISDLKQEQQELEQEAQSPKIENRLAEIQDRRRRLEAQLEAIPANKLVYAVATQFTGGGQFKPTEGEPRPIHLLHRGDVGSPGERMFPGAPPLWKNAPVAFAKGESWSEGQARAALARYLTHPDNPLLWRSIANRLWQWAFTQPLVGTPNDFGRMGSEPTHPELLDYLAARLRDDPQQSLKSMIRLLVTSRAYRRSSDHEESNAKVDSGNRYLWRFNRRRLTAEEFRDSLLAVSGALRLQPRGGRSFRDFVIEKPQHSPHYQYHLHDPGDPASHRRTIYRFVVRSQPQPMLTSLDCADPSISVPRRTESTTALQALTQWNNRLVEAMSTLFAARLEREAPASTERRLQRACELALGRPPDSHEKPVLMKILGSEGEATLARVLVNMSAFTYVE